MKGEDFSSRCGVVRSTLTLKTKSNQSIYLFIDVNASITLNRRSIFAYRSCWSILNESHNTVKPLADGIPGHTSINKLPRLRYTIL